MKPLIILNNLDWKPLKTNKSLYMLNKSDIQELFCHLNFCGNLRVWKWKAFKWMHFFKFRHQINRALYFPVICPPFSYQIKQAMVAIAKKQLFFSFVILLSMQTIELDCVSEHQQCPWLLLTTIWVCNHPSTNPSVF